MPKLRRPHVASPDEIKITREGDYALIEYADPRVGSTRFRVGADMLASMSDAELLAFWNEHIDASEAFIRSRTFTATEISIGEPQFEYYEPGDQWVPRGDILRGVIVSDAAAPVDLNQPFISIDDRDFTVAEFVKMVGTFGGWGMRIAFVPDDQIHERPKVKVREPKQASKNRRNAKGE